LVAWGEPREGDEADRSWDDVDLLTLPPPTPPFEFLLESLGFALGAPACGCPCWGWLWTLFVGDLSTPC